MLEPREVFVGEERDVAALVDLLHRDLFDAADARSLHLAELKVDVLIAKRIAHPPPSRVWTRVDGRIGEVPAQLSQVSGLQGKGGGKRNQQREKRDRQPFPYGKGVSPDFSLDDPMEETHLDVRSLQRVS